MTSEIKVSDTVGTVLGNNTPRMFVVSVNEKTAKCGWFNRLTAKYEFEELPLEVLTK